MPENLKTTGDTAYYNEDDFVEQDGKMVELTVTITLCEYRNMVREQAQNEYIIDDLRKQISQLTLELSDTRERLYLADRTPEERHE